MNEIYVEGYEAYYNEIDDCPYDFDTEFLDWSDWCDGNNDAYCVEEGK